MRRSMMAVLCFAMTVLVCSCGGGQPDVNATSQNMERILVHMQMVSADDARKRKLRSPEVKDKAGAAGMGAAVKAGIFEDDIVAALIAPGTGDEAADVAAVKSSGTLSSTNCSFCLPKMSDLMMVLNFRGANRKVVVCPNSRHWRAFGASVPVLFSDSDRTVMATLADLKEFGITQADWDNPSSMFGKKAPFDMVFE
jgi:hypothetical protein